MLPDWLRPDGFPAALRAFGLARCSWSGEALCLGLGPDPARNRRPLDGIPANPRKVCFFAGPTQVALVRAFVTSPRARQVQDLFIGTSHDYAVKGPAAYDMTAAVAALKGARLPQLRAMSLGDMQMLSNGHRLFGTLGDISHVLASAPALTRLRLHGHFRLPRPQQHPRLEELLVEVDDIGITDGPLDQETVSSLLTSDFPALKTCSLDLAVADTQDLFTLPPAFLTGTPFPALQTLDLTALTPQAKAQLDLWRAQRGLK